MNALRVRVGYFQGGSGAFAESATEYSAAQSDTATSRRRAADTTVTRRSGRGIGMCWLTSLTPPVSLARGFSFTRSSKTGLSLQKILSAPRQAAHTPAIERQHLEGVPIRLLAAEQQIV
jgi:hypothetical protein